jgi:hypothetical protein
MLPLGVQEDREASKLIVVSKKQMQAMLQRQRRVPDHGAVLLRVGVKVVGPKKRRRRPLTLEEKEKLWRAKRRAEAERGVQPRDETYREWKRRVVREVRLQATGGQGLAFLFRDMDDFTPEAWREALVVPRPGCDADKETVQLTYQPPEGRLLDMNKGSRPPRYVMSLRMMWAEVRSLHISSGFRLSAGLT